MAGRQQTAPPQKRRSKDATARMQTVLLAREIARMMRWDGDSKGSVNRHFASVTELHCTMGYIGNLSIEDVLKSVLMAALKASTNRSLRDAYHKVLDDLDDDKVLSFDLIQDACARQFRRTLTSATLLHGVATIPALHGVTKAPTVRLVLRSTKRAPSLVTVCLPFFTTSSTIMVSRL
jgi:hypothetical protein